MANQKFFRRGKTQMRFLPTVAATTLIPTAAECGRDRPGAAVGGGEGILVHEQGHPDPEPRVAVHGGDPRRRHRAAVDADVLPARHAEHAANHAREKAPSGSIVVAHFKIGALAAADVVDTWPVISAGTPDQFDLTNNAAKWDALVDHTAAPQLDGAMIA